MLELFPGGFEEVDRTGGVELVAYTDAGGEERLWHAFGGARMGDDPATSVVDRFGMAHEVPNLALLGGSTFPTSTGSPPTETMEALAWRTADHIGERWSQLAKA